MRLFLLSVLSLAILPIAVLKAQEATPYEAMPGGLYELDKTHASLTWKVSHLGLSDYTARFTDFDAKLMYDPMEVENTKLIATVNPTSIETDYPGEKDFDGELVNKAGWFNVEQFPEIEFRSTNIERVGDDKANVTGDLTFLGVTKPVILDVTFNKAMGNHPFANKPALGFSATGTIKRSDFGMTKYIPQIGDEVDLLIEAEFLHAE
jgi:polyisoprenoid-binding protein YceI